jgi:hypothetical protein
MGIGVGDRIHVSGVENETDLHGSSAWIGKFVFVLVKPLVKKPSSNLTFRVSFNIAVEKVTLFTTTVYWGATLEKATINNASIANSRIINHRRTPHAQLEIELKFAVDVPYERVVIFKSAVEAYIKARPREWLRLNDFRATHVAVERGFISYKVVALSRNSWQRYVTLLPAPIRLCYSTIEHLIVAS